VTAIVPIRIAAIIPAGTAANGTTTDHPVIAYRDASNLAAKVARCEGAAPAGCASAGDWSTHPIVNPVANANFGRGASIVVDSDGYQRLAYYDQTSAVLRLLAGNAIYGGGAAQFTATASFTGTLSSPVGLSLAFGAGRTWMGFGSGSLQTRAVSAR